MNVWEDIIFGILFFILRMYAQLDRLCLSVCEKFFVWVRLRIVCVLDSVWLAVVVLGSV